MAKKVLRTVQPAYKSDRITVAQAKRAWLKVEAEAESRNGGATTQVPRKPASTSRSKKA